MGKNHQYFTIALPLTDVFYLLLLLVHVQTTHAAYSCEDHIDCQALLKLKQSVTNDPFYSLHSWSEVNPFCNWTGVACSSARFRDRVTALELPNMLLEGSISPFLSNLSLLTALSLQENRFSGRIPGSIGQLLDLAYVNMTYNNLSGRIPDELGAIRSLTYLDLSVNSLEGVVPPALANLTELIRLGLAVNYLTGIPLEIGTLKKLKIMYLHTNHLEGEIPSSISNCTALEEISLIENALRGQIPSELGNLRNLKRLYLSNNRLSGKIPLALSNLSQLILLDVSINELEGEAPLELGKLNNLQNLYLHSNNLVSKPGDDSFSLLTALTNCSFLQKLHLGSCWFSGMLPSRVGDLSKDLYYFKLFDNLLIGDVPDSIGNLSGLVNLNLGRNRLNGTVPSTLRKLGKLQRLYLGKNKLHGKIPGEIGQMGSLGLLDLGDNSFEGSIPTELGNLSQLKYLYMFRNQLSGNLPVELTRCTGLLLLDLSYNKLQGRIPREIGLFSELALALNLSNNNLEAEVPASIGRLVSVQAIDLSRNNLSGVIPSLIGSCLSLDLLNFSRNMLDGIIPDSLKQITSLRVLDLAYNDLTGTVPMWIGNSKAIENLNLSYNRLTGEVPSTGRFKYLNRTSFLGNPGLCRDSGPIGLPPCRGERKKHKNKTWIYAVSVTLGCGVLVTVLFIGLRCYHRRLTTNGVNLGKLSLFQLRAHEGRKFTLRELEIATAGFNEENLLGRGSFGSVYKAVIEDGNMTVALKILDRDCVQSHKSFKREWRILSTVRHRNLVRMVGSVWSPQFKALVLEFIDNGNLAQHLYNIKSEEGRECKLTLKERISILLDIAKGLEYLHERCSVQILHCDLKPQNLLLDREMVAHVADFGIGKLVEEDKTSGSNSSTGFLRGTFGYMPPEYGQGIVSPKGDVYSFGVVLLETMTRKSPMSEEFSDGLNLRKWVISLYPDNIWEAIDKSLKKEVASGSGTEDNLNKYWNCCAKVICAALVEARDLHVFKA
ncbi:hypothetical protein CRG98_029535 [Punica granatum]|uniref:non-specific serine/threonine protein kinase n=1 Tax=Punica granatum TaxID=22663 RepID=A0A2I0J1H3_PUNGR|nr:hypothetical protein CRG98_029535 [Punica granatum]